MRRLRDRAISRPRNVNMEHEVEIAFVDERGGRAGGQASASLTGTGATIGIHYGNRIEIPILAASAVRRIAGDLHALCLGLRIKGIVGAHLQCITSGKCRRKTKDSVAGELVAWFHSHHIELVFRAFVFHMHGEELRAPIGRAGWLVRCNQDRRVERRSRC